MSHHDSERGKLPIGVVFEHSPLLAASNGARNQYSNKKFYRSLFLEVSVPIRGPKRIKRDALDLLAIPQVPLVEIDLARPR
jgi:hypothetical protein